MGNRTATLHEVAAHAGVSIATVSRVATGVGQVSPGMRTKVSAAIDELGYRPSHLGRALVRRSHAALGVVFPGLSGPYYSEVIAGFEQEAIAARLSVLILGTHQAREAVDLALDMADRVDGLAVMGGGGAQALLTRLRRSRIPVVQLAGEPFEGVPTIASEGRRSVQRLTRHLLVDHGYQRVAFVGTPEDSPDVRQRWLGFLDAHQRAGVSPPPAPILAAHDQPGGIAVADQLAADRRRRPQALVCANDESALGVLIGALGRGWDVPRDIAITGFDDLPAAALTSPGLTTVHQPMRELGARTVRLLREAMDGELDPSTHIVLPTRVIRRSSCGCAPRTSRRRAARR